MYCGAVEGLARHLETILRISLGKANIMTMSGDYFHNTLLPYISDFVEHALLFSSPQSQGCVNRVRQALRLLGIDSYALLSKPLHEATGYVVAESGGAMELDDSLYRLAISLANIKLGLRIGAESRRIKRMEGETKLSNIAREVVELYSKAIEAAEKCNMVITTHSLVTVGEELSDLGYLHITVDKMSMYMRFTNSAALFYTTAEEHIVREALSVTRAPPTPKLIHVKINTDPLTAPLYGLILVQYMRLRKTIATEERHVVI